MNKWLQFLSEHGARYDEATSDILGFAASGAEPATRNFVAPLSDLGLLQFSGEDAAGFLHNQLTNDVEHLDANEARLAGYCSPKGRLLATFLMWKTDDGVVLQLPRQILPAVQKRLQMFVLRAKVKIADLSEERAMLGLCGEAATATLRNLFSTVPDVAYAKIDTDKGSLIRLADAEGTPRYLWVAGADAAMQAWPQLSSALTPAASAAWRLGDIQAALPRVVAETQDKFVPQMVNFEVVGGVNFKKGCYPGQEIVARSQYLGKLKRRMVPALIETESVKAGMEVFSETDPEQPCGMIVNAEVCAPNRTAVLVEMKTAAMENRIHLGAADGPLLHIKPLPYALPDAA
jgi:hypothetical protein